MKVQVTITRTDIGANTRIKSDSGEASKDYPSWEDAFTEANDVGLVNIVESTAAKLLPPGLPFHTNADIESLTLTAQGFVSGKAQPPQ